MKHLEVSGAVRHIYIYIYIYIIRRLKVKQKHTVRESAINSKGIRRYKSAYNKMLG